MKRFCFYLMVFLCANPVYYCGAEDLPLWEAGAGFTSLSLPDYRGSSEQRDYLLPFPYLVYRGDILRLDRKGNYILLLQSKRVGLNVSADGGIPVRSGRNASRKDMPRLFPTLQIGPVLEVCLASACDAGLSIQFRLPIRTVIASDFSRYDGIGFVMNPQLTVDFENLGQDSGWNFGCAVGPLFATERFHDYYYQVSPEYAVPGSRPSYDARGGYSGSLIIGSVSKRFKNTWFGAFARYDDLKRAVFEDSPLMRTRHSFMAGFGFAWVFGKSSTLVQAAQ
jgi:outer membrane scaffolding protein for murein synthesis (MipA/OmpV family)